ncbi:MAG: hypothetical protein QXW97_02780 [Candidatus Pacearchaeota archaeon]
MAGKYIIFDSGPLINFAMNNMLGILIKIKESFSVEFLITKEVKQEIIDYPITLKKYEYEALQLQDIFNKGIIKHANLTDEQINELRKIREEIMNLANSTFYTNKNNIPLLEKGECAALALSVIIKEPNIIAVDERTTRMLCESPENLKKLLENKFHTKIMARKENYEFFKRFKIIRSTELAYISYKKGFFEIKDTRTLDAALWALKLHGCSISEIEIEQMKKM